MSLINGKKILGIITEYNPFHNGHLHHIEASKSLTNSDYTIAIMSGHFTQRGEPAIADPWTRAKWAVESGVDLVIQLPVLFSTASAQHFAHGAVSLLHALNGVDALCFGSETGQITTLNAAIDQLSAIEQTLRENTKNEKSTAFSRQRDQLLSQLGHGAIKTSNDILGIAYLQSLNALNSPIEAQCIPRIHNQYHSLDLGHPIASATAIRTQLLIQNKDAVKHTLPNSTIQTIDHLDFTAPNMDQFYSFIALKLRLADIGTLDHIHDMADGLSERLKTAALSSTDRHQFLELIKTKAYTNGRLQRVCLKMLLNILKTDLLPDFESSPHYLRILAFNDKGREILSKAQPSLPFITNAKHYRPENSAASRQWQLDQDAANLYNLLFTPHRPAGDQMRKTPLYIK